MCRCCSWLFRLFLLLKGTALAIRRDANLYLGLLPDPAKPKIGYNQEKKPKKAGEQDHRTLKNRFLINQGIANPPIRKTDSVVVFSNLPTAPETDRYGNWGLWVLLGIGGGLILPPENLSAYRILQHYRKTHAPIYHPI